MANDIDIANLKIKIKGDSSNAVENIDTLIESLERLQRVSHIANVSTKDINKINQSITKLNRALDKALK